MTLIGLCIFQGILTFKQGSYINHYLTFGIALMLARQAAVVRHEFATLRTRQMRQYWHEYYLRFRQSQATPEQAT